MSYSWSDTYLIKKDIPYLIPDEKIDLLQIYFKKKNHRTGFTEISYIHVIFSLQAIDFVTSVISTCCSVCLASSLGWLYIHLYCCHFERKEKILFCLFLYQNYRPRFSFVWQPCIFFWKKNVRQASKIHYYLTKSFSLRRAHTLALWNFTASCRREGEREKFEIFKTKKERIKKRIKKVTSVPSSNTFIVVVIVIVRLAAHEQSCLAPCRRVARNQFLFEEAHIKHTYTHTQLVPAEQSSFYSFLSLPFSFVFLVS
jgi:hypothetical protein